MQDNNYKPLTQEKPQSQQYSELSSEFLSFLGGLIVGIVFFSIIIILGGAEPHIYTNQTCQELIDNSSISAYESGVFYVINYTQSTGNILYITKDGYLNQTSINEQCEYVYNLNKEVYDGR